MSALLALLKFLAETAKDNPVIFALLAFGATFLLLRKTAFAEVRSREGRFWLVAISTLIAGAATACAALGLDLDN